jgi:Rrf2 family protein
MLYSQKCEYAVRALTHLAGRPGERTQLQEVAADEGIPLPFLGKILLELTRAGLLRSAKGPRGGYELARPAASITLFDVKEAIDGTADLERCAVGLGQCSDAMPCPHHDTYKPLRQAIRSYLERTTLEQMAQALSRKRALLAGERAGARGRKTAGRAAGGNRKRKPAGKRR